MKNILLSITILLTVTQQLSALVSYHCEDKEQCISQRPIDVDTFSEAFSKGVVQGDIRAANINYNYAASPSTLATSIGGQLKYETAKLYNTSLAVSTYVSQKIPTLSGKDEHLATDFVGENNNSIVYLGEAYVDYEYNQLHFRLGRQKVDTPLNNRDDIRMLPNTFEAAMLGYGGLEHFVFVGGYITRWAGFDSDDDISEFKNILDNSDQGVALLGVTNDTLPNTQLQLWVYSIPGLSRISYADALYSKVYSNDIGLEGGIQTGFYNELDASGVDGEVYGVKFDMSYRNLTILSAFNAVHAHDNKSIILGYGGGPYFTSMEEMTIDKINDVQAYVVGAEYLFLEQLNLHYAYGHFKGNELGIDIEVEEHDIVLSYTKDSWDMELSYAKINDKLYSDLNDNGYDRLLFRANYNFRTQ